MRAITITGFKNSGKTSLAGLLAPVLEKLGRTVAIVKFTHHNLDLPQRDTYDLCAPDRPAAAISETAAAIFYRGNHSLLNMLSRLSADIVLVEGGKSLAFLPRVLCLRDETDVALLQPEIAIATYGQISIPGLPSFNETTLINLARLVDEKAFVLGGLDCGECGQANCAALTREIVTGAATPSACTALDTSSISLRLNGNPLPLNKFTAGMIEGALRGMLSTLKGMSAGRIDITLK